MQRSLRCYLQRQDSRYGLSGELWSANSCCGKQSVWRGVRESG